MAENNTQSRKWTLTINNPADYGLDHDEIIHLAMLFSPDYFCLADEIGASGTYHTHLYLYSHSPMRFGTIKNRFPTAHIEKANGTSAANRDYIRKEGKWAETDKAETSVPDTFFEFGNLPTETEERAPKMYELLQEIAEGKTTLQIIQSNPDYAFKGKDIDTLREIVMLDRYRTENRDLVVNYIYGATGTGKTRSIYAQHPASDICRITEYGEKTGVRFDSYHGHPVLVFEEFHSQIPIAEMLNYLDIYPLMLPARYSDRIACYTTVYITSNVPLWAQYTDIQRCKLETWRAFLRRISTVIEYLEDGTTKDRTNDYKMDKADDNPFTDND